MNISDLNKDAGKTTGSGISYTDNASSVTTLDNPNIRTSVSSNKSNLKVADLSHLPQKEESTDGVIKKESIEQDLLGEGSVFETYLENKKKEIAEVNAAIDAHNEMVAARLGEEVPDEITDEDVARSRMAAQVGSINEYVDTNIDKDDYIDPLEQELEEDGYISNIDAIEKQTSSNVIANTIKSEDLGQDVSFKIDDEDLLDDEEDDNDTSKEDEENLEELRTVVSDKLSAASKKLDLKAFTITNRAVSAKSALINSEKKTADWALFSSKMHFALSEFSGTEISSLHMYP